MIVNVLIICSIFDISDTLKKLTCPVYINVLLNLSIFKLFKEIMPGYI